MDGRSICRVWLHGEAGSVLWANAETPAVCKNTNVAADVFLDYPVFHSLQLTYPNGTVHTASLQEAVLPEDETSRYVVPTIRNRANLSLTLFLLGKLI